ncbi:MAG: glycosyltransferase family 2 protein [Candidatus Omnitrophica bacterium]|nr:glycosyltransferase family 2 protein [Candidatus Omnitrophota bacterium]
MSLKVLIIVPAFNESGNISHVVEDIKSSGFPCEILVVDDGSTDDTALVARLAGANVVSLPFNLGIGGAVQTGFLYAARYGFDVAIQFDGDGQHDAQFLNNLIKPIVENYSDMVIGSRFLPPNLGYQSSWVRRMGIHFFSGLISFLTGMTITDPTSGFRACNRKAIEIFAYDYPLDFPEPESVVELKKSKLRIVEVAVQMKKRVSGHSSIRYLKTLYYMIKVTCAILLRMIQTKKQVGDHGA